MSKSKKRPQRSTARDDLPEGVSLALTLDGHTADIGRPAWTPDGSTLATSSNDGEVRLWNTNTGECIRVFLSDHTSAADDVAIDPAGRTLASWSRPGTVHVWDISTGSLLHTIQAGNPLGRRGLLAFNPRGGTLAIPGSPLRILDVASGEVSSTIDEHAFVTAFHHDGNMLAVSSREGETHVVSLWLLKEHRVLHRLTHPSTVYGVAFEPTGSLVVTACEDHVVRLWDPITGALLRTLEGHTGIVDWAEFSSDGRLLASKSDDNTVRVWRCDTWTTVAAWRERKAQRHLQHGLVFHPSQPLLATIGSGRVAKGRNVDRLVHIWKLDEQVLFSKPSEPSAHYVNAKVVLLGDTGVGKSGLSLVLNHQPFAATESTPGRRVWTFDSREVTVEKGIQQTREILLWDLAGQPGYRVIHQLHLNEVAVALVVFDARSETDPLAGVRHWERALRLAHKRQGTASVPMTKLLVSARNDRGGVSIGEERLQAILKDFGFDGYFKTSAKEGWAISELRGAIERAISWDQLPKVSSTQLFTAIKAFLLGVKKTGRLLAPASQLYGDFAHVHADISREVRDLREQFETCIGRLENRDLIRRLTFGGYVLLQPELLDAYASAMVNTAKEEPDGLGSLAEEVALTGRFFVPEEQRVSDPGQQQLLLHATVEELVRHDLALRENADDGRYLVFPSQFNRDYEDAPEPKGKAVAISFEGPVQSLYSTLAVRLGHSGLFTVGRAEMWRNAAVFTARAGGKCGLFVHEFAEGRGRLILFFDDAATAETRFHFEEYILAHTQRRSLDNSVELTRFFVCSSCGDPVPDTYVKRLRDRGSASFACPCGGNVSLAEPRERIHFPSVVEAMDQSADRHRDFDAFVMSAKGETTTTRFHQWAGGERVTLAITFTDVVGSTALGEDIKDEAMNEVRRAHFAQSRRLIGEFRGREVKTIGDSFMAAFRSVDASLDYALALQENPGDPRLRVRAGIHIGSMQVEADDVFGGTVNFAARVVGAIKGPEIWLSARAKEDIDRLGAAKHKHCIWERHDGVAMKGFAGGFTLWRLRAHTL